MNQSFNTRLEFHKRSELGDSCNRATNAVPRVVLSGHCIPGMRLQLLHADGNPTLAGVIRDLKHPGFDLLPDGKHVGGLADTAPGTVTHVQQSVYSTQIDE